MGTRETQARIIKRAVDLFNDHGLKAVSVNRIADALGMSRGNLHYHFPTKDALIEAIFDRLAADLAEGGAQDAQATTRAHMRVMFDRYMTTIWDYRFLYRELTSLLRRNPRLRRRYADMRARRLADLTRYFESLIRAGELPAPQPPATVEKLVTVSWLICDNWLTFVETGGWEMDPARRQAGFELLECLFAAPLGADPDEVSARPFATSPRG